MKHCLRNISLVCFVCNIVFLSTFSFAAVPFGFFRLSKILPKNLTLTQSANSKTFTVDWTAGKNNGGVGGCRIEYQKQSDNSWVTVASPLLVNCDTSGASAGTITLPSDGWNGTAWTSARSVRLVRVSDLSVLGTLGALTCTSRAGSSTSTPTIDEDCNNNWDNSTSGYSSWTYYSTCGGNNCTLTNRQYSFAAPSGSCNRADANFKICSDLGYQYMEVTYGTTCYCSNSSSFTTGLSDIGIIYTSTLYN